MPDNRTSPLPYLGALALVFLGGWIVYQTQQDSQIVRPFPNAPPAPVVPQLPDLAAKLRRAKSLCEGLARQAKGKAAERRIRQGQFELGRRLYTEAKSESDGSIEYLCAGLTRRFNQDDPQRVAERMAEMNRKMAAFVRWADRQLPRKGDISADLPDLAKELLLAWLNGVRTANDEAIAQLQAELRACQMQGWEDLGN
jgi:hypothetical protein